MTASASCLVHLMYTLTMALTLATSDLDNLSREEIKDIEEFAGDVMGCANIPGLALGVVRGDAAFSAGLGVANMLTGHTVDKRTMINLGSASKAFVPYIMAEIMNGKENHDGRLTWNSTLWDILRHDRRVDVPFDWAETSLKDLLIYKSGSSAADLSTMAGLPYNVTREELFRRLRFLPRSPEFRNSNHHSNYMYTIAGYIAERISGMSWEEIVQAKVFDKLMMDSSWFAPEGLAADDAALPYRFHPGKPREQFLEQNDTLFNLHPFEPSSSLMTSAEDMTKWLRNILHNLNARGNDSGINMLISDAFHLWVSAPAGHRDGALMHDSEFSLGYGMGWYASTYRGERRFKFSGSLYAYSTQIWIFPDSFSAIFVSVNGPGAESTLRALDGVMYHISDVVLRKPSWVNIDIACCCHENDSASDFYGGQKNNLSQKDGKAVKYLAPVQNYIGQFGNGFIGNLDIKLNDAGVLVLKLGRNLIGELMPDVNESKLKFFVSGSLVNTEEWRQIKKFEFLQGDEGNNRSLFQKVRIYIKDKLFYDFERGKLFEDVLVLAEEIDRQQKEEIRMFVQNRRKHNNKNYPFDTKGDNDVNGHVNDESDEHGKYNTVDSLHNNDKDGGEKTIGSDSKSGSGLSEGHESHWPSRSDQENIDPNFHETEQDGKSAAMGLESPRKNSSSPSSGSMAFKLQTFSISIFLLVLLHILYAV